MVALSKRVSSSMKRAIFLDRDGVINIDKKYLFKIEDFEFVDGIFDMCRYFISQGYIIIVITNQSGINRGFYTTKQFKTLNRWMIDYFKKEHITISDTYFCPHRPDELCECRKPKPTMINKASKKFDIDKKNSIMIGDKMTDIQSAIDANIGTTVLFDETNQHKKSKATFHINNLRELIQKISLQ